MDGFREMTDDINSFLKHITGVIHIGAHHGQERDLYASHGLDVLWIEGNPEVFGQLLENLRNYPSQHAIKALVTDKTKRDQIFYITSNDGASSSIFNLKKHLDVWPGVTLTKTRILPTKTMNTIETGEKSYQAWVMDTQGSELLVLKGAGNKLDSLDYIKTEAADFEAYDGCCTDLEISEFLGRHGFLEVARCKIAGKSDVGYYYDILYKKS